VCPIAGVIIVIVIALAIGCPIMKLVNRRNKVKTDKLFNEVTKYIKHARIRVVTDCGEEEWPWDSESVEEEEAARPDRTRANQVVVIETQV